MVAAAHVSAVFASRHGDCWESRPFVVSAAPPEVLCSLVARCCSDLSCRWPWLSPQPPCPDAAWFVEPDLLFEPTAFAVADSHALTAELAALPLWTPPAVTSPRDVRLARRFCATRWSPVELFEAADTFDERPSSVAGGLPSRAARVQAARFLLGAQRHD